MNGFRSPYRTPQTIDLLDSLTLFKLGFDTKTLYFRRNLAEPRSKPEIPIMVNAGNHDLKEDPDRVSVGAFERVWGDTYFTFWSHGKLFISLETQFFRSENQETKQLMAEQLDWLEDTLSDVSPTSPKTVFMHVPLFIEHADETDSDKGGFEETNFRICRNKTPS